MDREPAPALVRGLHLLRLLADGGPATLEDLVRGTAVPRTSLARMLTALERCRVVARDADRRWHALVGITLQATSLPAAVPPMAPLVAKGDRRLEFWRFDADGVSLAEAADPPGWPVRVFVYPGWRPDVRELMAPVILWWALAAPRPAPRAWHWRNQRRVWLPAATVRSLADAARRGRRAVCPAANLLGLRRTARQVLGADGRAVGALVEVEREGWRR